LFGRLVFGGIAAEPHDGNNDVAESNEATTRPPSALVTDSDDAIG
jgi:hypothetical protein